MARRGRPRTFDRKDALLRAMRLFWTHGYEGATLSALQEAMGGIAAPSFYAAFGSKEDLFREAVQLYSRTLGEPMTSALAEQPSARAAIEMLLRAAAEAFTKPGAPRGCMLVLTALDSAPPHPVVQKYLRRLRARRRKAIEQRVRRGIEEGELPAVLQPAELGSFLTTVIDGLAIQARDGASRKALYFAVRCAMAAWDSLMAEAR